MTERADARTCAAASPTTAPANTKATARGVTRRCRSGSLPERPSSVRESSGTPSYSTDVPDGSDDTGAIEPSRTPPHHEASASSGEMPRRAAVELDVTIIAIVAVGVVAFREL